MSAFGLDLDSIRFGRQARPGEHGASGAITKTEVAANRYRDFGRDNSLEGLMLTHRPQANRLV